MQPQLSPAHRWNSPHGRALIRRLVRGERDLTEICSELKLLDWECRHLQLSVDAIRRQIKKQRRGGKLKRMPMVQLLAEKIDAIKALSEPNKLRVGQLSQKHFQGTKAHLALLLASVQMPVKQNDWNSWRRKFPRVVPNLRGANLSGIDLGQVRLHHVVLANADLSGCIARSGNFSHADLRGCSLRHADLTAANLTGAKLKNTLLDHVILTQADLAAADLHGATLLGTVLNRANLRGADIRGALVWGASVWDVEYDVHTKQQGLKITSDGLDPFESYEPDAALGVKEYVEVDNLDVAHLMSLLMKNPKIGTVLDEASSKIVLLLGRFTGEDRAVLEALQAALPHFGYVPIVFDFPELKDRDTIETVATLAGMSRFVIASLSQPRSTPLEAHLIIPQIAVPFVPIIRSGEEPFSMFKALQLKYPWVLETVGYRSEKQLIGHLEQRVIRPAENESRRLRRLKHPPQSR